jgi:hypothetical protein
LKKGLKRKTRGEDFMYRTVRVLVSSLALVVVVLGLGAYSLARAQAGSTSASIVGTLADEQGGVIGGATVSVKNKSTNITREANTLEDGTYLVPQLSPGSYEITVNAEGFATQISRIDLELGTVTRANFTMKIAAEKGIVIEVKAATAINESKTESSTNQDRGRIDNLPINRRNFLDFTLTSPRATVERTPAAGVTASSGLSFNGLPGRFNNITIDGLDNNNIFSGTARSTFSQDAVQEFQVVSDSFSAEFGRALGGVVNIVTRGGSNDIHGNVFSLIRNDELSARNAFASFDPDFKQYQFGSILSGPVKKDKAFFFLSFERLSIKQNNIVTISDQTVAAARRIGIPAANGALPFSIGTTSFLGRVDAQLNANDKLNVRYNFGGTYDGNQEPFGGLTSQEGTNIQRLKDNTIALNNTYISGSSLVNETRFQYSRRELSLDVVDAGPTIQLVAPEGIVQLGKPIGRPFARDENIYQIVDNVSLSKGRHQIKFGADFVYREGPAKQLLFQGGFAVFQPLPFEQILGIPGAPFLSGLQAFDPSLRTPEQIGFLNIVANVLPMMIPGFPKVPLASLSIPVAYNNGTGDPKDPFFRPTAPLSNKFFSAFLQDDIKLKPNLVLKAGIRYDIQRQRFVPPNDGNFSPRIALSYRPGAFKDKLAIHASYGIYFTTLYELATNLVQGFQSGQAKVQTIPFPFSILVFSLPNHRVPDGLLVPPGAAAPPQLSTTFEFQKDLRVGYTQQSTFGFNYFINSDTVFTVDYTYVRGAKIIAESRANPVIRPGNNPVEGLLFGRVDPTRGDVINYISAHDSYFHGVSFIFNRRLSNKIGFLAHYTLSKAIDNFPDVRLDLTDGPNDPRDRTAERSLSGQDRRHRLVASGTWDLDYTKNPFLTGFQLSTILNVNSGPPFNLLAGVDLNRNGDNPPFDRPPFVGRNAGVLPGFATVDMRLTRFVKINENIRIQGFVEIFNLFNRVNISKVDRVFPPDATGRFNLPPNTGENGRYIATPDRFRESFAPRQIQLGIKFNF